MAMGQRHPLPVWASGPPIRSGPLLGPGRRGLGLGPARHFTLYPLGPMVFCCLLLPVRLSRPARPKLQINRSVETEAWSRIALFFSFLPALKLLKENIGKAKEKTTFKCTF